MRVYRFSLDTRSFCFEASGLDRGKTEKVFHTGIKKHCEQFKLDCAGFKKEFMPGLEIEKIELDIFYRDNQTLD